MLIIYVSHSLSNPNLLLNWTTAKNTISNLFNAILAIAIMATWLSEIALGALQTTSALRMHIEFICVRCIHQLDLGTGSGDHIGLCIWMKEYARFSIFACIGLFTFNKLIFYANQFFHSNYNDVQETWDRVCGRSPKDIGLPTDKILPF